MMTDLEITQEAERLVDLDERQLEIEMVSVALRLGSQSEESAEELQRLDRECLDAIIGTERNTIESLRDESEGEIVAG